MPKGENNRKLSESDIDEIARLYTTPAPDGTWTGITLIARQFGVRHNTIRLWLIKRGVEMRSAKEAHAHGKQCKPTKNLPPSGERPPLCKCGCNRCVSWNQRKNNWNKYVEGHYRPKRLYHDPDWLEREYVENGRSTNDIAAQFDVTSGTICHALDAARIPRRSQAESLRLSGAVSGANNAAWKGGVADWDYAQNWKSLCKLVKDRDRWTCQACGKTRKHWGHKLHVHHIDGDKTNNHPHNLISVCSVCHYAAHSKDGLKVDLPAIAIANTKDESKYIW